MSFIIVLLVIIVAIGFIIVVIHNKIIARYNNAQRAWADVIVQERQKNKILPELQKVVEQYRVHETSVLTGITELRTSLNQLSNDTANMDQLKSTQLKTRSLINNLYAVSENYPDLKASNLYGNLMKEITEQQDNIGAAIRIFNGNVADFNTGIEVFPASLINSSLTKKQRLNVFNDEEAAQGFEYKPNF